MTAGEIQVSNGEYARFVRPDDFKFRISVIAHSLSNLCRFTGHTARFYSVAQHSVLVSEVLQDQTKEIQQQGLLHDAVESILGDVSTPLKAFLPGYRNLEAQWERELCKQFGLPFPFHPAVKAADKILLVTEKRDLMPIRCEDVGRWPEFEEFKPLDRRIHPLDPYHAEVLFLHRAYELGLA